jgi:hypothetical protein
MKAFFLSRLFREKLLLLALVLMAATTWLWSATNRTARFWREFRATSVLLEGQRELLAQQSRIEAEAKAAIEHLEPSKTFDGVRLQAEIAAIAARTGVKNYSADNVQTERVSQFSMNSMQLQIRTVNWETLTHFYFELSKEAPYIGIEQFRLSATNANHNVAMRVSSVEIAK